MVGFAAGGAFLSLAYWDMPYYLMVIGVATGMLVRARSGQGVAQTAPGGTAAPSSWQTGSKRA